MNNSACILTDNTAQLPYGVFPGQRLIKILPLEVDECSVSSPSVEGFTQAYCELEREFESILVLTLSNQFVPAAQIAHQAALQHGGLAQIAVLDSKQTGPGLGILAQLGAQAILDGASLAKVEEHIRAATAHIYTLIHVEAASLAHAAFGPTHTETAETGLFPLLLLDDGQLAPYKKVRTRRHLLETFQEFIEEFETPQSITFLRGRHSAIPAHSLREFVRECFPQTSFSDMEMSAPLARLFGSEAVGITVMEMPIR